MCFSSEQIFRSTVRVRKREKERCDLGAMTERSGVFSAVATGVPITTTNIVLDEPYKTMNQSASSSSPGQNQDHNTTTNNMYNTVTAASANININRTGASDSEEYSYLFRTKLNLNKDWVRPTGERLSSNNSNDVWSVGSRDRQKSLSGDSGYFLSQDSGMAAEDDMILGGHLMDDYHPEPDISSIFEFDQYDDSWGLLPANVTTSNSNPPQPLQIAVEKNHQGEVAREVRVIISRSIWAFILSHQNFFFFTLVISCLFFFNKMPMKTVYHE